MSFTAAKLETFPLVQASSMTGRRDRSITELARVIAARTWWRMDGEGRVVDLDGLVAASLEDLAAAADELGWFDPDSIRWELIPVSPFTRADAVRSRVDPFGRHPQVRR